MEHCEMAIFVNDEMEYYNCRLDGQWCKSFADFDTCRYGIIIQQYKELKCHGTDNNDANKSTIQVHTT